MDRASARCCEGVEFESRKELRISIFSECFDFVKKRKRLVFIPLLPKVVVIDYCADP